ncbi:helix-turn-helix domain-containing protein [Candidatus Daviesbacteria bacterium]|nr:helix-turn-helix domain-containing protein [Candidatus Daviesbacteria bacterium]
MSLNNRYSFPEVKLGPDFAKENLKNFKQLIDTALSFVVVSMPGVGVSSFLRYLSTQHFAHFIHIDLYDLPTLTQHEFYKLLLTELGGKSESKTDEQLLSESKEILKTLSQKWGKIVLIFSRFDQLKKEFDWNFLSNIQSLTTVFPGKIVLIFTSTKPLHEIASEALTGGNLNFYSEQVYFQPYSKDDLKKLLKIEPARPTSKGRLEKLVDLSGGHNQLLHILLRSQKEQPLLDNFVKMQLKELVDYLDYHQRKQLQKIALGKQVKEIDEYLSGVGLVKNSQIFTPLLAEYIKINLPVKLPVKEGKLFKLLKIHIGQTVTKEEIFANIWGADDGNATDWALDALIYRLRKHPFIKSHGYTIESQKKVGYTLIQT